MIPLRRPQSVAQAPRLIPYPGRFQRRSGPRAIRRLWRLPLLLIHLGLALPLGWWVYGRQKEAPRQLRIFQWWCRRALRILGIRLRVDGTLPAQTLMMTANHVSYLDILALASVAPGQFVAKKEMRAWPLFGMMGAWLGTLYIDRQDARASQRILKQAAELLRQGHRVTIFPEGTTTDGTYVGEFFAAPFEAAVAAAVPVLPVTLRYEDLLRPGHADRLCPFIGDDSLAGHLWRLMAAAPTTLRIHLGPLLAPELGRRVLATQARQEIVDTLGRMEEGALVTWLHRNRRHPLRDAWFAWRHHRRQQGG